jgi:hypothetical protein
LRKSELKTQEDDYLYKANQLRLKTPTKAVQTQFYKYDTLPHKKQAKNNVKCMTGNVGIFHFFFLSLSFEIFQGSRQFIIYFRGKVPQPDSYKQQSGYHNDPKEKVSMQNIQIIANIELFPPRLRYSRGYRDVSDWVEEVKGEEEFEDQSEKERERFE